MFQVRKILTIFVRWSLARNSKTFTIEFSITCILIRSIADATFIIIDILHSIAELVERIIRRNGFVSFLANPKVHDLGYVRLEVRILGVYLAHTIVEVFYFKE